MYEMSKIRAYKVYRRNNVKYTTEYVTKDCSRKTKDVSLKYVNCNSANYRG